MSFLPNSRPTLPPIRDVFPEFSWKVDPPSDLPLTRARPWSNDDQKSKSLPAQYPLVHSIYEFRHSDTEFCGTSSALLHYRLSDGHMVSLVQPDTSHSFFPSFSPPHQVLPQNPSSANPRYSQGISPSTDTEYVEALEPALVARYNDVSSAPTHPPSLTHGVQHEGRNSSASYDCSYCGKMFNRPSSLKIHSNSHTGEKPFACPVQDCGRSFSVLSNMRRHARVHGSYAEVSLPDSASDHYPSPLSSTSSNLGLSSPIQSHRRYSSTSGSSSTSRKTHSSIFGQWRRGKILRCKYNAAP